MPPKSILAPIAFSGRSTASFPAVNVLAARWASEVEIVHVNPGLPADISRGMDPSEDIKRAEAYGKLLDDRLRQAAKAVPGANARLIDGDPLQVLERIAAGGGVDLIVMATHGRAGLMRFMLGSVTEHVVHVSRVPVLTMHQETKPDWPKKILVPMTLADYADRALLCAQEWAEAFTATLTVVHVVEDQDHAAGENNALEEHLQQLLGPVAYDKVGLVIRRGRPAQSILEEAEIGDYDLVVLAAHLKSFWKDMILGTTAERVLRHARVPVLSVP